MSKTHYTAGLAILLSSLLFSGSVFGFQDTDDGKKPETKKAESKPAKVSVESKPMRVFAIFDGVIESSKTSEVKTDVDVWTDLIVKEVVEEGSSVKKGEVVLKFKTEKIDDAIAEADVNLKGATLDFEDAKLAAEQAITELKLNSDLNEREMKNAKDDYQYYQEVERDERQKDLEWSLKFSDYSVEYAEEELNQLLQMYTEDELTEESEKIVLKRAQRSLDSAKRRQEQTRLRSKRQKTTAFPREDVQREDSLKRQELQYEKTKTTLPFALDRAEIGLKKADFALEKAKKKWADLRADLEKMTLTSPEDGILYHGRNVGGKWVGATGASTRTLESEKKIGPNKVVLTVIDPSRLVIRAEIPEDKIRFVKTGTDGTAFMSSDNSLQMPVSLTTLKRVPLPSGKFECMFDIKNFDNSDMKVLPAMNCKVSIRVYENDDATVVPKASVFTDDGFNHYVYLSKNQRKDVEIGHTSGDYVEITKGLSVGDKILKSKP